MKIPVTPLRALGKSSLEIDFGDLTVLFGRNNCGKTSILVGATDYLVAHRDLLGGGADDFLMDFISINRFYSETSYNFNNETDARQKEQRYNQRRIRSVLTAGLTGGVDWINEFSIQEEEVREQARAWFSLHFEELKFEDIMQGRRVVDVQPRIAGLHPLDQGTGARAMLPIIIQLYSRDLKFLAIDEPELSLEPRMQKILFEAIKDASLGRNGFPRKQVVIATHSHLFLDRETITNNYRVEKSEHIVQARQLKTWDDIHDATFNLLGSNPSDLFFPANVVIVEGRSDAIFLKAISNLKGFTKRLSFHFVEGITKTPEGLEGVVQMLKTLSYVLVYKDKVCVLLDDPNKGEEKTVHEVRRYLKDEDGSRVVVLSQSGIEYYYPLGVINREFKTGLSTAEYEAEVERFHKSISKKHPYLGSFLGLTLSKADLAERVSSALTEEDLAEVSSTIVNLLRKADDLAFKDSK